MELRREKCPIITVIRVSNQRTNDDGALEQQCSRCQEWWPADLEFFYSAGHGKLMAMCKACYLENRYPGGRSAKQYRAREASHH